MNTYTCTLTHQSIDVPWSIFSAVSIIPVRDNWEQLFWWISEEKKNIYDQIYYPMNIQHDCFNSPAVTAIVSISNARPDLISGDFSSFAKQIPVYSWSWWVGSGPCLHQCFQLCSSSLLANPSSPTHPSWAQTLKKCKETLCATNKYQPSYWWTGCQMIAWVCEMSGGTFVSTVLTL